jgi:hypothetical protein
MHQLLITDFIKSRIVLLSLIFGLALDLLIANTINHILILFCLPYGTSVALNYLMNTPRLSKPKARISEQYRRPRSGNNIIRITPSR